DGPGRAGGGPLAARRSVGRGAMRPRRRMPARPGLARPPLRGVLARLPYLACQRVDAPPVTDHRALALFFVG
ncbi:MAG: hypothetical protein ACLPN6_05085, partial [Streptosporangiaceae bacterium]